MCRRFSEMWVHCGLSFSFLKTEVDPGTVVMKRSSRFICCGDTSGKVIQLELLSLCSPWTGSLTLCGPPVDWVPDSLGPPGWLGPRLSGSPLIIGSLTLWVPLDDWVPDSLGPPWWLGPWLSGSPLMIGSWLSGPPLMIGSLTLWVPLGDWVPDSLGSPWWFGPVSGFPFLVIGFWPLDLSPCCVFNGLCIEEFTSSIE